MLKMHFQTTLGKEVIDASTKIRLLTDPKTKKSKGMAFIELNSPEAMYECLRMHLTHLDGRRLNVERTSGGGAASKKAKILSHREEQAMFISETIDKILSDHIATGEIDKEELDEGVILLCKRHSATVVEQALKEYVAEKKLRRERKEKWGEKEEDEFRNPSAFLTHMIGRVAEEGLSVGGSAGHKDGSGNSGARDQSKNKKVECNKNERGGNDSIFEKSGVDMSMSFPNEGSDSKIASIFPSMSRGRGRGRGYMY
jgi:RNA recognition motif-containing protein